MIELITLHRMYVPQQAFAQMNSYMMSCWEDAATEPCFEYPVTYEYSSFFSWFNDFEN